MMTDTLVGVSPPPDPVGAGDAEDRELNPAELAAVEDLVRRARQAGVALTGPNGLRQAMTKSVVEATLEEEIADQLGCDKHAIEGRHRANSHNGKRSKTVLTDSCGEVDIDVPATATAARTWPQSSQPSTSIFRAQPPSASMGTPRTFGGGRGLNRGAFEMKRGLRCRHA